MTFMDNSKTFLTENPSTKHMADQASSPAAPPSYSPTNTTSTFGMVSFHVLDRIRFLHFPAADIARIQAVVGIFWDKGIRHSKSYSVSHEIKLKGYPWLASGTPRDSKGRLLTQHVLSELYDMGWVLESTVLVSKKADQKDTLLLRRFDPPPTPCDWFTISFDQLHVLTVLNGPAEVSQYLIQLFSQNLWSSESAFLDERLEIRLKKDFWMPNGHDTVTLRLMLLQIADALESFGFKIYASLRLANTSDVLICKRPREAV